MKLELQRNPTFADATVGRLYVNGTMLCHTLEDAIREIPGVPVEKWKVFGKTAIPAGTYRVTLEYSPRFGVDTPTLHDVQGFKHIRIHAGNGADDTEGCILVGMQATERSLIGGTSRPAVNLVKKELLEATERGESITIVIRNPQ